jgi:hypothetical protein
MSASFANINVRSGDQVAVAAAVRRLPRRMGDLVSPAENGWVTVFDQASDAPDEDRLSGYTTMLSGTLHTRAVGVLVYESDVLLITLAEDGKLLDHYSSWPDYFDETMGLKEYEALAGKPDVLARFARPPVSPAQVEAVLDEEHDFAEEKLAALAALLGLPEKTAHWGYNDIVEAVQEDDPAEPSPQWAGFMKIEQAFPTLQPTE